MGMELCEEDTTIVGKDVLVMTRSGPFMGHVSRWEPGFLILNWVHTLEPSRIAQGQMEWRPMPPLKGKELNLSMQSVVYWFETAELEQLIIKAGPEAQK